MDILKASVIGAVIGMAVYAKTEPPFYKTTEYQQHQQRFPMFIGLPIGVCLALGLTNHD